MQGQAAAFVLGLALVATPASADVRLAINGGRVSLSAKNATVSQILTEWARVGQTKIVNGDRVGGAPLTLELTNVSEVEAIEILLRSAGGYLLAPRHTETANGSRYDRILIFPAGTAQRAGVVPAPVPSARAFPQPQPSQQFNQPAPQSDENDGPPERSNAPNGPTQNGRPAVFNTFPQPPQRTSPPPASAPTSTLTAPAGVATPGMVAPTPQPGQPGAPDTPQ